ncbi:XRE family transcriptional regulator [Rhizobium leguminosarum bv. viciae]|nr:XRE family transcriptional regulator [Rhizobium leguminosarum bv. viciae]
MTDVKLKHLRGFVPLTQAAFANRMGVPARTLQDIEANKSATRPIHVNAAKWAVFETLAVDAIKGMAVPDDFIDLASRLLEVVAVPDACPVCKRPGVVRAARTGGDYSEYNCENCGTYRISGTAEAMWGHKKPVDHFRALGNARLKAELDTIPMIMSYSFD